MKILVTCTPNIYSVSWWSSWSGCVAAARYLSSAARCSGPARSARCRAGSPRCWTSACRTYSWASRQSHQCHTSSPAGPGASPSPTLPAPPAYPVVIAPLWTVLAPPSWRWARWGLPGCHPGAQVWGHVNKLWQTRACRVTHTSVSLYIWGPKMTWCSTLVHL